jgi:hypothetical protein
MGFYSCPAGQPIYKTKNGAFHQLYPLTKPTHTTYINDILMIY